MLESKSSALPLGDAPRSLKDPRGAPYKGSRAPAQTGKKGRPDKDLPSGCGGGGASL